MPDRDTSRPHDLGGGTCPRCGVTLPAADTQSQPDVLASPGCWQAFNEVLAREYSDLARMAVHHLTVDTYMVQHLYSDDGVRPQRSSVNAHLLAFYLNRKLNLGQAPLQRIRSEISSKDVSTTLAWRPATTAKALTIRIVLEAETSQAHVQAVEQWAESLWWQWSPRSAEFEELARLIGVAT